MQGEGTYDQQVLSVSEASGGGNDAACPERSSGGFWFRI